MARVLDRGGGEPGGTRTGEEGGGEAPGSGQAEEDGMEHEEEGVQPHLPARAMLRMDPFVLGDEEAREERRGRERCGPSRGRRKDENQGVTCEYRQGVEGVPPAFPRGQAPAAVVPAFIGEHAQGMDDEGQGGQAPHGDQALRSRAPYTVSPGPKARLVMRVPGATPSSLSMSAQTWGRVAEDMFP
jgi:hypothetical protein